MICLRAFEIGNIWINWKLTLLKQAVNEPLRLPFIVIILPVRILRISYLLVLIIDWDCFLQILRTQNLNIAVWGPTPWTQLSWCLICHRIKASIVWMHTNCCISSRRDTSSVIKRFRHHNWRTVSWFASLFLILTYLIISLSFWCWMSFCEWTPLLCVRQVRTFHWGKYLLLVSLLCNFKLSSFTVW